ncbi:MAG: hypothetical protein HGA96_13670, partial [Desulfobulbaceae bacterium]|nr:hypothetical protein [Desulfobulbaceae bacterium]
MKRHVVIGFMLWLMTMVTGNAWGYYLDTPHNESNGIYCYTCHEMPEMKLSAATWAARKAANPDDTMMNAICLSCHAEASPPTHKGPPMQMHSSSTTTNAHGVWTTECTQCHDVHFQGQLDWESTDRAKLFLAQGQFSTALQAGFFNAADPQGEGYGTTIVGIASVSGQLGWTDTSKWGAKGGHRDADKATDLSRGLIITPDRMNRTTTFEIIGVSGNVLKVKGNMLKDVSDGGLFGVFYGQSLKSSVMPNGGISADDYRDVKFFEPNIIAGASGGYVDLTPSATKPVGLCQVCHDATSAWNSSNTAASHHQDTDCDTCHNLVDRPAGISQAITDFAPPANKTYGDAPITLSASGGASGNPVTFSVVSGPGSVSGTNNSTLTITGAGTIVVRASQAGDSTYAAAANVNASIIVAAKAVTVTANNTSRAYGDTNPANPGFTPAGLVGTDSVSGVTYTYQGTASATAAALSTHTITPSGAEDRAAW